MFKRHRTLSIRSKIATGYIAIAVLLGFILVVLSGRISQFEQETDQLSGRDMRIFELTYRLENNVLEMETAQRGYAITGVESYLTPYRQAVVEWRVNYARLAILLDNAPEMLRQVELIGGNIDRWINESAEVVIDMKRHGQDEEVSAYYLGDPGKTLVETILNQTQSLRDDEKLLTERRIAELKRHNDTLMITLYILWALVAVAALASARIISGNIAGTLKKVTAAIGEIAGGGNLAERIVVNTRDEIYELGSATNDLLETVEREKITADRMKAMSLALQESSDLEGLARAYLDKLAEMLPFQYGALYAADQEGALELAGDYAGSGLDLLSPRSKVKPGESLLGQCYASLRTIQVHDVPERYYKVGSGLGDSAAHHAAMVPVQFEGRGLGVVELASLKALNADDMELLDKLNEMLGIALHSILTRMELHKLYGESQALNEELQSHADMQQRNTKRLMELNDRLEQNSKYKSEFLANMSHELRTPLNGMLNLSQMLTENPDSHLTGEEKEYLSVIHSSSRELLGMIEDMLDYANLEADKLEVERGPVNVTELPALLHDYFDQTAAERGLDFTVEVDPGVPELIVTDELRMHQVLRKLISNAFKFTERGGVRVTISMLEQASFSDYRSNFPHLAVFVADSGIGISAGQRERIFELFHQGDGSAIRKYGGAGIGLSLSLRLAKLLGGHITLESRPEEGSTFTFLLPLDNDAAYEHK